MAAGDYQGNGTGTLPVSGPGTQSSVTLTATGCLPTSRVLISETKRVRDAVGALHAYISAVSTDSLTIKSDRDQLPETLTFNWIAFATA